jgi:hypothetical protein
VLRIRDVYPGSRIRLFSIPDPGSRIPDPNRLHPRSRIPDPHPEPRRAARQEIPGPLSSRVLRGASSEMEQMHNYISSNGTELHEAIGNRDTP